MTAPRVRIGELLVEAQIITREQLDEALTLQKKDGRRLAIRGPEITTPGGNRISGDYSRHNFSYVVPASEPSGRSVLLLI